MDLPVYVLTNDKHLWLLQGFFHQFAKYWPDQSVVVAGYQHPNLALPAFARFMSLAPTNYPADKWSDGLLLLLDRIPSDVFVLLLEDYWLYQPVQVPVVHLLYQFMQKRAGKVLRMDLSNDRASMKEAIPFGYLGESRIIRTPPEAPYQLSFQAAIWSKKLLRAVLQPGWNPWEAEIEGSKRLAECGQSSPMVLGTRIRPLVYEAVWRCRRRRFIPTLIPPEDMAEIQHLMQSGVMQSGVVEGTP